MKVRSSVSQVLVAWFSYSRERLRKKARYQDAMEKHRMFLLRQGVTQWLTVASDMAGIRQKIAAKQGAEVRF